ncbi:nuclear transport factor 2 family protein [Streptomyces sp. NPDC048483]|uniref:YybH family protein n=1 Tax=Streptomyces sp. NPDC048483 TaxID=3154927 RepID=UPI003423EA6C
MTTTDHAENTGTERKTDEAAIRELLQDRATATAERDAERFLGHCAPEIVDFGLAPPLRLTGPEALDRQAVEAWYATWEGPVEVTSTQIEITVGDGVAFAHSINRMHGAKACDSEVQLWFRATVGLRKIDGVWRITHVHESVPFRMDGSGLAALDLTP